MRFHQDGTAPTDTYGLDEGMADGAWIFVFGSNLAGIHGAGAAKVARQQFGAKYGVGSGPTGSAYAIPTKDENLNPLSLEEINEHVERFVSYVESNPELKYWVTRVGCGLAGNSDEDVAPMFAWATTLTDTISWPKPWAPYLQD